MKKLLLLFALFTAFTANGQVRLIEDSLQKHFRNNKDKLDPLEGIWEVSSALEYYYHDTLFDVERTRIPARVAITKKNKGFEILNLSDEKQDAIFEITEVPGVYRHKAFFTKTNEYSASQVVIIKQGEMDFSYDYPENYIKMLSGTVYKEGIRMVQVLKWTKIL